MDRVAIKNKAKEMIRGNKWYIWKPYLIMMLIALGAVVVGVLIDGLLGFVKEETVEVLGVKTTNYSLGPFSGIISIVASFVEAVFTVWYCKYLLDFVHGVKKEFNLKAFFEYFKKYWVICFVASLLVGLNIIIGTILLIVPGIMATFGLMLYAYTIAEEPELRVTDALRKTWALTNGHKMELFILVLSFIGWEIVAGFTLGILYIWLIPYMMVTVTLAYESLKGTTK
jgi:uncharacterized membrane protein